MSTSTAKPSSERLVPVFPLPEHVFFPGIARPYRIFEPRFRTMIRDLLDKAPAERWLAVATLNPRADRQGVAGPGVQPVATVGRLIRCEGLGHGDFHIVVGEGYRAEIGEIIGGEPYARARATWMPDDPGDPDALSGCLDALVQGILTLAARIGPEAAGISALAADRARPDLLSYRLASVLVHGPERRYAVLAETCPVARLRKLVDVVGGLLVVASRRRPGDTPKA